MAKSQLAFDIATQTPTTFSVDQKGVLSWAEIIEAKEGDALHCDRAGLAQANGLSLRHNQITPRF